MGNLTFYLYKDNLILYISTNKAHISNILVYKRKDLMDLVCLHTSNSGGCIWDFFLGHTNMVLWIHLIWQYPLRVKLCPRQTLSKIFSLNSGGCDM